MVEEGSLSSGAARALLSIENAALVPDAARRVVREGLSVRDAERLAKRLNTPTAPEKREVRVDYLGRVAQRLTHSLGRKVRISGGEKRGKIELEYYDSEDFELLCSALEAINAKKEKKK
jgi:ParB family chromosome partitioning protein